MASEAQQEFTRRMDALLQEGLPLFGMEQNSQLGDWVCVVSAPYLNDEGDLTSGYAISFSGNLLQHNAMGLLAKGNELLVDGEDYEDD